jgi:putative ABC transport system permease protein
MKLAIVGVVLGVSFSFAVTQFITSYLYEVKPWDPTVFVGVPVLLSVVAMLAIWIPARRASRINPIDALRYE